MARPGCLAFSHCGVGPRRPAFTRGRGKTLSCMATNNITYQSRSPGRAWQAALLAWLLATALGTAHAEDSYYAGRCADGRTLYFLLTGTGTNTSVSMHLEGLAPQDLEFKTNRARIMEFGTEAEGARWPVAGLRLATTNLAAGTSGSVFLISETNGRPFTAARVAVKADLTRNRGLRLWSRGGGKQFEASWPDFRDKVLLHEAVSKRLAAEAHGEAARFIKGATEITWEGMKDGGASFDWEGMLDTGIVWLGTNLVSLFQTRYEYTGGAHGSSTALGRNFVLTGGKAREFALADLFRPGTEWVEALSVACLRELRLQHASWVMPDTLPAFQVKEFKAEALGSFNVDRAALFIHFDPYAVGPYVEGTFHVAIPWRELEKLLDPRGPISQLQ